MASWNDLHEGNRLEPCPVCRAQMKKKKLITHLTECCQKYEEHMADEGLIKCPLYPYHILPKEYLNHHLDGNCEEAQNMLRKYFHIAKEQQKAKKPPDHFLQDVPDEILNTQNKQLLFYVKRDLNGRDISSDKLLYPDD